MNASTTQAMAPVTTYKPSPLNLDGLPTWALLLAGAALLILSGMRFGVDALAWIAPVPFLLAATRAQTWRARLLLLLVLQVATGLQILKIITEPIPPVFALLFSVPMALGAWLLYLFWAWLQRRMGPIHGIYAFAALSGVSAWLTATTSDMGVWGSMANTQLDNLPFLQLASLVGVPGMDFFMGWVAAFLAALLQKPNKLLPHALALSLIASGVYVYGTLRLSNPQGSTVRAAAIVTDLGVEDGLPPQAALEENTQLLFQRSLLAVQRGARLIAWNEGAAMVEPEQEQALLRRGQAFARQHGVDLVLAYISPQSHEPLLFLNRYAWIAQDGELLEIYDKHHPVPGEPSVQGTAPLQVLERPYGKAAGAICYDFDFPSHARALARGGAGLLVVPSSDWAGIDPLHTKMARVRAVESGVNVLRPVRWATSAGFDTQGRVRGWMPVSEDNDRVLVVDLPTTKTATVYASLGDAPMSLAALYLLGLLLLSLRRLKAERAGSGASHAHHLGDQ